MADPELVGVKEWLVYIEVPTEPGVWHFLCGLNSFGLNGTANTTETPVRDCDDPTAMPVRRVTINYFSHDFSGSGPVAKEFVPIVEAAWEAGDNVQLRAGIAGLGYWEGPYKITARNVGAEAEGYVSYDLTFMSDGAVPYTASATFPTVP